MFSLYEGSVKVGFESESLIELLKKLNLSKSEEEYGYQRFSGCVDLYETPDEWSHFVEDYYFNDEYIEDDDEREKMAREFLRDAGMPRKIEPGQMVICFCGDEDEYILVDGALDINVINEALSTCFVDEGYKIAEA